MLCRSCSHLFSVLAYGSGFDVIITEYGSENLGSLGVENILIAAFLDPDRAMDLVEYFRAQLQEEE